MKMLQTYLIMIIPLLFIMLIQVIKKRGNKSSRKIIIIKVKHAAPQAQNVIYFELERMIYTGDSSSSYKLNYF